MPRHRDPVLLAAIGARIKRLRTERGLSQERLAEHAAIEPQTLSHVENGHHGASLPALATMARALGVGLGELVDVSLPVPPPPAPPSREEWIALWDGMTEPQRLLSIKLARDVFAT